MHTVVNVENFLVCSYDISDGKTSISTLVPSLSRRLYIWMIFMNSCVIPEAATNDLYQF